MVIVVVLWLLWLFLWCCWYQLLRHHTGDGKLWYALQCSPVVSLLPGAAYAFSHQKANDVRSRRDLFCVCS